MCNIRDQFLDTIYWAGVYLYSLSLATHVLSNRGTSEGGSIRTALVVTLAVAVLAVGAAGLAAAQDDDRFEPNDAVNESATPERGTYEDLTLDDDEDFYEIQLEEGQEVNVTLAFDHTRGDVDVAILAANETTLVDSMTASDGEQLQYTASSTGTHYVRVWPYWGSSTTYDLHLESDSAIQSDGGLLGGDNLVLLLGAVALAGVGYVVFVRE